MLLPFYFLISKIKKKNKEKKKKKRRKYIKDA